MHRGLLPAVILLSPATSPALAATPAPEGNQAAPNRAPAQALATSAGAANGTHNPYGRAIDLMVDVQFYKRDLGEVSLHMAADGSTSFDGGDMAALLKPLLNEVGQAKLATIATRRSINPADLKAIGITALFDRENVAITIAAIDPSLRKAVSIFGQENGESERQINAYPADISFFLNTSVSQSRLWNGPHSGFSDPSIFLNSAVRVGPVVLEGEGQIADRDPYSTNRQYRFDRNFLRLVYDRPEDYLRATVGDLTPEVRFQQNYVQMGGFGISRERRRFDEFRSAFLQGNHQLILDRESTVDLYRNGILFQQLQLEPGSYDLSNLPLLSGSNDIRLAVHDAAGNSQTINYQTYLDPIDLDPGDYEASVYVGKLARRFGLSPKYNGELALTGFYRKAFLDHPAIGFGLQASRSVQQLSGQTEFLIGSGRIDATIGASHSKLGNGYLAALVYDLVLDQGERSTSVSLQGVFQSRYFTGLGAALQDNSSALNASAILTHTFSPTLSVQGGATYIGNRLPLRNSYRVFAESYYRLSSKWFVRAGVDYQHLSQLGASKRQNGFGFNISIVFRPRLEDRAEARYDYHFDNAELSYQHSPDNYVGAIGYGALLSHDQYVSSAQGYMSYAGNRFDASLTHSLFGAGFGQMTDRQVTTARVSSAIAFADGAFALAPRIGDSFAILEPHSSLQGHQVILGQLLDDSRYRSESGALGGAVAGSLASYVTQSIQYDVVDPPPGYDVGLGVYRVRPPYHSGYRLVVGSDAFVTAIGTLFDASGKPLGLATGELGDSSRPQEKAVPFFTNSVGRFALISLRPNDRYQVRLFSGSSFEFTVPSSNAGLLDLHHVMIAPK